MQLKSARSLREVATDPALILLLDAQISEARAVVHGALPTEEALTKAASDVAAAEIKNAKAVEHLATAQHHVRLSEADLASARRELDDMKRRIKICI